MNPAELLLISWSNIHRSQRPGIILAERYFSLVDAVPPLNETWTRLRHGLRLKSIPSYVATSNYAIILKVA